MLHSLYTGNFDALKSWLAVAPRNCVTVLDTHDGIGIHDVARQGDLEGLLADDEVDSLVNTIHNKTGGDSARASGNAASNLDIYQVNSTYYDALGQNDIEYLIARAIQFFAPGTPQIYYVGLLAGANDISLVKKTGVGRDINRHYFTREEIQTDLQRLVVKRLMELIRLRNSLSVFDGSFTIEDGPQDQLGLRWDHDGSWAALNVDMGRRQAMIRYSDAGRSGSFAIDDTNTLEKAGKS